MNIEQRELLSERVSREYFRAVALSDTGRMEIWEDLGLTMPQMRVMLIVGNEPGIPSGALAATLGVQPSTVTGIVDRLERQALVRSEHADDDRRVIRTSLTRRGVEVMTNVANESRPYLGQILDGMDDVDLLTLALGLDRLTAKAEEMGLLPQAAPSCSRTPAPSI